MKRNDDDIISGKLSEIENVVTSLFATDTIKFFPARNFLEQKWAQLKNTGTVKLNIFTYDIVFPMVENPRNYI